MWSRNVSESRLQSVSQACWMSNVELSTVARLDAPRIRVLVGLIWRLTQLVLRTQCPSRQIPYSPFRFLEARRTRRKSYTIWLRNPPGRCHGAVEQLPERGGDAMTARDQLISSQPVVPNLIQFPCFRAVKEERVVRTKHKAYLGHCLVAEAVLLVRKSVKLWCSAQRRVRGLDRSL
jgi:hypothetical protein